MKKLIMFFSGLMLLVITGATLCVTAAIFDAGQKYTIDTFFFQTNNLSHMRLGVPARPVDLGDAKIRDMLINKFVHEYFYVIPDMTNVQNRISGASALNSMASPAVFNKWKKDQAPKIQELAEAHALRRVRVIGPATKPADSDYWQVAYELETWAHPNDMFESPKITDGIMRMNIVPETGLIKLRESKNIGKYLESGNDPAAIFKFRVLDLEYQ